MKVRLSGGIRDGMITDVDDHLDCVELCYVDNPEAVTIAPNNPMPEQRVLTQKYRRTNEHDDDGRVVFRHMLHEKAVLVISDIAKENAALRKQLAQAQRRILELETDIDTGRGYL